MRGFEVGIRRFRDSWERYSPDDPERLLDIAIAFEAIFLNDGVNRELRYRLALRAARFLADSVSDRQMVFRTMTMHYDFRSAIAHGDTPTTLRPKDAERLASVLVEAPRLLREVIRRFVLGAGPRGLAGEELCAWWRSLELG